MQDLKPSYIKTFANDDLELSTEDLSVLYGSLQFKKNTITALIGASGSGKSTFLRSLNRMNDRVATVNGKIWFHGLDVNKPNINVYELRKNIGMVFQA